MSVLGNGTLPGLKALILLIAGCFLAGCTLTASIDPKSLLQVTPDIKTQTVYAGDTLPITASSVTDSGSGWWDAVAGLLKVPASILGGTQELLTITDAQNSQSLLNVTVRGFADDLVTPFDPNVDDQVFTSDSVWTTAGNIFVSTIASDAQGERWAVFRSSDHGASWNKVDHFMGVDYDGESHPLSMATNGTDVYVCGYVYSYNWNSWGAGATDPASAWVIRKSSDQGQTWATMDYYAPVVGSNHVCYAVAISPVTGYIYTGGYDSGGWIVRESRDQGATWSTIYTENAGGENTITQIKVSPSGDVWVMGRASSGLALRKGTYSAGSWTWTGQTATFPAGSVAKSDYELGGVLRIVSDTTAYFAMTANTEARIIKTTDGGATWSTVYSAASSMLAGLVITPNGTILANGGARKTYWPTANPGRWTIVRSTDAGATWNTVYNRPSVDAGVTGYGLTMIANSSGNDVMAFAYKDLNYQGLTLYSANDGVNWTPMAEVNFLWKFWTTIYSVVTSPAGEIYMTVNAGSLDGISRWTVRKSSDTGVTWSTVDSYMVASGTNTYADQIMRTSSGVLLVTGTTYISPSAHTLVRRSSDNGTTWSTVLDLTNAANVGYIKQIVEMNNGDLIAATYGNTGSSLLKSTDQGLTWSTTTLTPPASATVYQAYGVSHLSDDSLWLMGTVNRGSGSELIVQKSTDGGATWTEKYHETWGNLNYPIVKSNGGVLYFIHSTNVYSSSDGGTTWTVDSIPGAWSLGSFEFDGSKIIVVGSNTAYTKSDFSSSWITLDQSSNKAPRYNYSIYDVLPCPVGGGVCVTATYEEPYTGNVNFFRRLK